MFPGFFEQDRDDHQGGPGEDGGNDADSHGRAGDSGGRRAGNAVRDWRHFMIADGIGRALLYAVGPVSAPTC
jgi:hypothetical protein